MGWVLGLVFSAFGCTPYIEPPGPAVATEGFYHRVGPGETLWSISRSYGVELKDLVRVNRIPEGSRIKVGQKLFVPGTAPLRRPSSASGGVPSKALPSRAFSAGSSHNGFAWPVEGKVISIFGMRRRSVVNKGIDIHAPSGAEVMASREGVVSFVHEDLPGFGKTIILDHGDGYATVYAYVGEIRVRKGERVAQRQVIARVGRTGRAEVSALHFEIRRDQKPKNPFHYLP